MIPHVIPCMSSARSSTYHKKWTWIVHILGYRISKSFAHFEMSPIVCPNYNFLCVPSPLYVVSIISSYVTS